MKDENAVAALRYIGDYDPGDLKPMPWIKVGTIQTRPPPRLPEYRFYSLFFEKLLKIHPEPGRSLFCGLFSRQTETARYSPACEDDRNLVHAVKHTSKRQGRRGRRPCLKAVAAIIFSDGLPEPDSFRHTPRILHRHFHQ